MKTKTVKVRTDEGAHADKQPRRALPLTVGAAIGLVLLWSNGPAPHAGERLAGMDDAAACGAAISIAQTNRGLPDGLLDAIGRVESGRADPLTRTVAPWPWTINANGTGLVFASKQEAVATAQRLQDRGVQSIDVGCMQINLRSHPSAFATLEDAFDPQLNVDYAARFLVQLYGRSASWMGAAMAYHSLTPERAAPYGARIAAAWGGPAADGGPPPAPYPWHPVSAPVASTMAFEPGTMFPVILPAALRAVVLLPHRRPGSAAGLGRTGLRIAVAVR